MYARGAKPDPVAYPRHARMPNRDVVTAGREVEPSPKSERDIPVPGDVAKKRIESTGDVEAARGVAKERIESAGGVVRCPWCW